jgi:hypothetical protein
MLPRTLLWSLALAIGLASPLSAQLTPENLSIAFIGDQGLGPDAEAVLQLIQDEGADAVIHSGDFEYIDSPALWEAQINGILGPDFPYFASVGNHDTLFFYGLGGYQELLEARMNRLAIPWTGDLGVQSSFVYEGIFVVLTAPGVFGAGDGYHDLYIRDELAADESIWRISSFHKNMQLMQVGSKDDSTGWGVYEESRRGGAIIATAHEHSYSRTHLLASMEFQTVASTSDPLVLSADDPATAGLDEGRSFAFVSGLGGQSVREQLLFGPWWASIYTETQLANHGALFGVFHYQGDPNLAYFYFKNIDGVVIDQFFVQSTLGSNEPRILIDDGSIVEGDSGSVDVVFQVTLLAPGELDVSVDYATADASATEPDDYQSTSGTLTLSAAAPVQTVSVPVNGDLDAEPNETFDLDLSNPDNATLLRATGIGTILDDDTPATQFSLGASSQGPGTGNVHVDPPGFVYDEGSVVTLTAVPDPGFVFLGWSGDLGGASNPTTLLMDAGKSVTASFDQPSGQSASVVEVVSGAAAASTSVSTAAPISAANGQLYLAAIASKPDAAVLTVSGLGLAWSPVQAQCSARHQTGVAVWAAQGVPSGSSIVTATLAEAPGNSVIAVSRLAGAPPDAIGAAASANTLGPNGACDGGTDGPAYAFDLTTTATGSLVYAAAAMRSKLHTPGPGFTEQAEVHGGSGGSEASVAVETASAGAPSTLSVSGSFSSDVDWAGVAVEVRSQPADPPDIVSFDPPIGPVGSEVTLTGSGFTDATLVAFGGAPASGFTLDSDAQIRATVPSAAVDGPITVSSSGGTAASLESFEVRLPACDDGVDNDLDGQIDWNGGPSGEPADPGCGGLAWRDREWARGCGLAFEPALALLLLARARSRRTRARGSRASGPRSRAGPGSGGGPVGSGPGPARA